MWLALIMALMSYLMSPRDTSTQRRRALTTALTAGALTYGVTEYTDWGQENLAPLDDKIDGFFSAEDVDPAAPVSTGGVSQAAKTNGWDVLKTWGPTEILATAGGVGALTGAIDWKLLLLGAGALLLITR